METVREQRGLDIQSSGFLPSQSKTTGPENQKNRVKITEFISWLVCFSIIASLTGLMKFLKLAVTVESVTSTLFYISIFAVAYFIYRIVSLSRNQVRLKDQMFHELN